MLHAIDRVNFKKLRPRAPILKGSKVLEELQHIATAEPERVQELKRTSTFLQKPQRPVPKPKIQPPEEDDGGTYKVVIRKQDKKTVIARLVEKGLLPPGSETPRTPEPAESEIPRTPEPSCEVKMHERENNLEKDSPGIDPNPPCSTLTLDTTNDSLSSCFPEPDMNESRFLEAQSTLVASSICNSQFLHAKPSPHRAPANKFTKKAATRPSKCARAHYAERILLGNVSIFGQRFCPETPRARKTRVVVLKRTRTRGRYLATFLRRESARLISLLTAVFQFLRKRDATESCEAPEVRRRRLSLKGRYLEHVLQKNVVPVLQCVKETCLVAGDREVDSAQKDEPKSTRTRGHYVEKCLHRQNLRMRCALASLLDCAKSTLDNKFFAISRSLRAKRGARARYFERLVRRNLEILELLAEYVRSKISEWLEDGPSCLSRKQPAAVTSSRTSDDSVAGELRMDPSAHGAESSEWREEGSSVVAGASSTSVANEEETDGSERNVLKRDGDLISPEEGSHEDSGPPQAADKAVEEEHAFSRFLQSTENYISAEVFHRGSRRLSRPRKSIDTVAGVDKDAFSKLLQSTEDYISAEVFHRGSRRLSRPRKSVDIVRKESDALSKFLQSTEDYISAEVFHRGSRRFSRRLSKDAGLENGALSSLLRSTGDYVSNEVFHRRSRRLSRSSKKDASCTAPIWWDGLKSMCVNLPWFSLRISEEDAERAGVYVGKIESEAERDGRRLSFVPTILYQGLTNHIGVDFTRLVAYAFVPCTSIVLLYLYK